MRTYKIYGPSPRAWGLPSARPRISGSSRAIPTCVGTTVIPSRKEGIPQGHPHVRGDYKLVARRESPLAGPSPRAWGLRLGGVEVGQNPRAIPTCVGTTVGWHFQKASPAGHPHVRGDYLQRVNRGGILGGPSPRAWGLRKLLFPPRLPIRAIPTCVGTTCTPWGTPLSVAGHPHVRGDYPAVEHCPAEQQGHPHVRGDYPGRGRTEKEGAGPSPRAWGLRAPLGGRRSGCRAIPTCVGTTMGRKCMVKPE